MTRIRTHYDGCWHDHLECAQGEIDRSRLADKSRELTLQVMAHEAQGADLGVSSKPDLHD